MGDANNRGTYEERKAKAIAREAEVANKEQEEVKKWWESLDEKKKEELVKNKSSIKRGRALHAVLLGLMDKE